MIVGIDVGSKFFKIASQDQENGISCQLYNEHYGNPEKEVSNVLKEFENGIKKIIFSGHYAQRLTECFDGSMEVDEISSIIEAVKYYDKKYRFVVSVGSGSIKFIELDGKGDFYSYKENSLCAAGTGSFLDEQMRRMNFEYETLHDLPFIKDAPDIATRCAVFAKSDLIHRQQEGYTKEEMWSGLCKGVVITMLHSVFKGDVPDENILFCGGLFLNPIVKMWAKEIVNNATFHEFGHFFSAMGSVVSNGRSVIGRNNNGNGKNIKKNVGNVNILESKLSNLVDFSAKKEYISNGNEIRIHEDIDSGLKVSLGVDIGSTSTKLVIINSDNKEVLIDIYRKTAGNPIAATKELFEEMKTIFSERDVEIIGAGTTGSGRKLIGEIIGADVIVNEITAHFKGATHFDSSIETIFEIGGQDSKYVRGYNGAVVDCNMNFVCAAGTGSFIEEQTNRLGYDVREIGYLVVGLKTPHTSDRCTVFMEQDINKLIREGYTREEVLAGIIRSIAKNYLNRVVGSRPITGDKIFFQGATARNKGLVAAFETLLQKEIVVSPYCHVMGSFGSALISINRTETGLSKFRGLDVFNQKIELEYTKCKKCANLCKITIAKFNNGMESSWGYMCGKEKFEDEKKSDSEDYFKKVFGLTHNARKDKNKVEKGQSLRPVKIGIPQVLPMYNHLPLWETFFNELGFDVQVFQRSSPALKETGVRISKADFCFPIKMGLAHIYSASENEDIDALFFPATLSEQKQKNNMPRKLCPYVIAFPSIAKNALGIEKEIISPSIDFRQKDSINIRALYSSLKKYGFSESDIKKAYENGRISYKNYLKNRFKMGHNILKEIKEGKKTGIAIIGRPYNLYDKIINLGLTERFQRDDIVVFPYECLIDPDDRRSEIPYMYWNYGERIISASEIIKDLDNVYPVYFTNFSCGPDSFILSRFEKVLQGKPYLIIELDEHGSETGYLTRIEAFIDVIFEKKRELSITKIEEEGFKSLWRDKNRKLWVPSMHEINGRLFAAAFRGWGFEAEALPLEDNEALEIGKQNIRGSECLPASTTVGSFLKKLEEIGANPSEHAIFMPTAEGPCRFGQYAVLHRSIMDKNGFEQAEIFSPSCINSYMGMPDSLRRCLLDAIIAGDMVMKYICKTRPYEVNKGETDQVAEEVLAQLEKQIEMKDDLIGATQIALQRLSDIPIEFCNKPLVGIVGEIYVRCNPFCNNNLIRHIENSGGEAWLSPMFEWLLYVAWMERYYPKLYKKNIFHRIPINIRTGHMFNRLHKFERETEKYFPNRMEPDIERVIEKGNAIFPLEFEGEAILTIGRAVVFLEEGADMVANCAPFGCMPGNITTSIFQNMQREYDKPIINLFYDGESDVNRIIGIYLNNIENKVPDMMTELV